MMSTGHVAITISRQLGSGGSYLGQQLARRFGFRYLDREILRRASETLDCADVAPKEVNEPPQRSWQTMVQSLISWSPDVQYLPPPLTMHRAHQCYDAESAMILRLAETQDVVVVGHGGFHVLQDHPCLVNLFCYASLPSRVLRVMEVYGASENEARAMIEASDHDRDRYVRALGGLHWADARNYHLCLDTSAIGLEIAVDFADRFITRKLQAMDRVLHYAEPCPI